MTKHLRVFAPLCACGVFLVSSVWAQQQPVRNALISSTLEAISACNHWAGETGDQTDERNLQIEQGLARDCAEARQKVAEIAQRFPGTDLLLSALAESVDSGTLTVMDASIRQYCHTQVQSMRDRLKASGSINADFKSVCPAEAQEVYIGK
jgi:hypothetical protein